MSSTHSDSLYHVVFSTYKRTPWIANEWRDRLYDYMGGIIRGMGGTSYAIGGMPDHVHLLVQWRTDPSVATLVRTVKAKSSRWVHLEFPNRKDFRWQVGSGVFTVSRSHTAAVKRYILNQEKHHRKRSSFEEYRRILDLHGIDYDPRYLE